MAWSASGIFVAFLNDTLEKTISPDLNTGGDTFTAALYGNVGTPARDAATADTYYNAGAWVTANEIYDGTEWAQGGRDLDSVDMTVSGTVIKWDAADEASGSSFSGTAYGVLVYDNTLTNNNGVCFNYLGGAAGVVDGTLTLVWHTDGLFTITV